MHVYNANFNTSIMTLIWRQDDEEPVSKTDSKTNSDLDCIISFVNSV